MVVLCHVCDTGRPTCHLGPCKPLPNGVFKLCTRQTYPAWRKEKLIDVDDIRNYDIRNYY